jgi:hypothetical protein
MGLFSGLFGGGQKERDARTTDEEINAILVPLGDQVADFKDRTEVSYTHILPAVNSIGVRLLVQARGLEPTRRLYAAMITDFDARGGIPVGSHIDIGKPPLAPERIAELNGMLWNIANGMIAKGHPVEHVAQAYTGFAMMIAERVASGDPWLAKYLLARASRELHSEGYGDAAGKPDDPERNADELLQPPGELDEPVKTLFKHFRNFIHLFKNQSGLNWEHLLPGIQYASTVLFIKNRGRQRTIEYLEQQIQIIDRYARNTVPKDFPEEPITPLHITNMAKFSEIILATADHYIESAECPPGDIGHALNMLVISISTTHFDLTRATAAFAVSCEQIKQGQFDEYPEGNC